MRVANAEHAARAWVINEIAPDFRLLDVWDLPVEGARDEFGAFLETLGSIDPGLVTRALFWIRSRLGSLLRWDDPSKARPIPGSTETTLRTRLYEGLRSSVDGVPAVARGFAPLFLTDDEFAAEISNETVHGVLQFTWIARGDRYRARLGVYVKARGALGRAYLVAIQPFRHLIVYPALVRGIGRAWEERAR
jgi:hypothetical protein